MRMDFNLDVRHFRDPHGVSPPPGMIRADMGRLALGLLRSFLYDPRRCAMAKTVIGLFDNLSAAQAVLRELAENGIAEHDLGFMADQGDGVPGPAQHNESEGEGADDARGIVITVAADEPGLAARAHAILERHGALDIDERDAEWKKQRSEERRVGEEGRSRWSPYH